MTSHADDLLRLASRYSAVGLPIFPINPLTDRPRVRWGKEASCERAQIEHWVNVWPDSVWGIAVPARFIVVDIDVKHGHDGFADFERLAGCHPDALATWQATTPSGGRHVWFDTDGHRYFRNTIGEIAPGLDTKTFRLPRDDDPSDEGGHGMVKAPPAPGRRWLAGEREPMKAGQWLKALFKPQHYAAPGDPAPAVGEHTLGGLAVIVSLAHHIANAPVGWRDKYRTKYAFVAGQFVGGGELNEAAAWDAILEATRSAIEGTGHEARRKEKCLRKSFDDGIKRPRSLQDDWGEANACDASASMSVEHYARAVGESGND
jgi:hypothetical protein